jgi:transcription initiation factor TFIID subunit 2
MTLMRAVQIEQPDYQWQYQLRHERDVTAQLEAIEALQNHSTPATRLALTDTIENEHCYYKVRLRAAHCLTKVNICIKFYNVRVILISYSTFFTCKLLLL